MENQLKILLEMVFVMQWYWGPIISIWSTETYENIDEFSLVNTDLFALTENVETDKTYFFHIEMFGAFLDLINIYCTMARKRFKWKKNNQ